MKIKINARIDKKTSGGTVLTLKIIGRNDFPFVCTEQIKKTSTGRSYQLGDS